MTGNNCVTIPIYSSVIDQWPIKVLYYWYCDSDDIIVCIIILLADIVIFMTLIPRYYSGLIPDDVLISIISIRWWWISIIRRLTDVTPVIFQLTGWHCCRGLLFSLTLLLAFWAIIVCCGIDDDYSVSLNDDYLLWPDRLFLLLLVFPYLFERPSYPYLLLLMTLRYW